MQYAVGIGSESCSGFVQRADKCGGSCGEVGVYSCVQEDVYQVLRVG